MRSFSVICLLCLPFGLAGAAETSADTAAADKLFQEGKFAEAKENYEAKFREDSSNYHVTGQLGAISLFSNRLAEAETWLKTALRLHPDLRQAKIMLAETYYRLGRFREAASLWRQAGREAEAKKLESFGDLTPYEVQWPGDHQAVLPFLVTDPLPLVAVRVNDSPAVNFLIDTGAAKIILDPEFAKEVGARQFDSQTGTFAGGKQASFRHGRVDSVTLGQFRSYALTFDFVAMRLFLKKGSSTLR
jgi:tetratricopeptide (TPR) repeat protein